MKMILISIAATASGGAAAIGAGYFIVAPIIGKILDKREER